MKDIIIKTFLAVGATVSVYACDFLDKPPGVDVTEDTVFSTERDFEAFLYGTYMIGMHSVYPYGANSNGGENPNPTNCMTAPITDEGEMAETWYSSQEWNTGSVRANNIINQEDSRFHLRWEAIRRCNIILERLPESSFTRSDIDHWMGEAYFIRALNNFEMFKRYGGMPIVKKRLTDDDNWDIPRSSLADFVQYIVDDCDAAARLLEGVTYNASERGRVTNAAALALKAKTLLYAASPLFNTAEPYIEYAHPELVCYGNYDANRWGEAAEAAKAALEAAAAQGFSILDTDDPENDYRNVWETYDNREIILAEKYNTNRGNWNEPWCYILPKGLLMNGWAAVCIPHNFIRLYEDMNGNLQQWNEPGLIGHDLMEKYAAMDPRFRQTVAYNGSSWNHNNPDMQLYEGATGTSPSPVDNITGAIMHKLIPYSMSNTTNYQMVPNGILFRVGELYLDYAEALNEFSGPTEEVYDAINVIRDRAGMPDFPSGLDKDEMRERIKNERAIELSFEDHRLWDLRRWLDAEDVLSGPYYKVVITRISGSGLNQVCDYVISQYEERTFHRNMYLHPIMESEVFKGYMFQNPGW